MSMAIGAITRTTPDASAVLSGFSFPAVDLTASDRQEWKEIFFDSVITEYDARRLYWYLEGNYPEVFNCMEDVLNPWLKDEIDHAYGFALIYASYSAIPFDEVSLSVELRKPDFSIVDAIAADPLKLLVTLAYDEIITTHVYHRSIESYDRFNSQQLSAWIRKTKKDEVTHFFAFVKKPESCSRIDCRRCRGYWRTFSVWTSRSPVTQEHLCWIITHRIFRFPSRKSRT